MDPDKLLRDRWLAPSGEPVVKKGMVRSLDYRRCRTCVWWGCEGGEDSSEYYPFGSGVCYHEKLQSGSLRHYPDAVTDGEEYSGIYTGPDFGCIHWEAKNEDG